MVCILILVSPGSIGHAISLGFDLDELDGPGWSATGVSVQASLPFADNFVLKVRIERFTLPGQAGRISDIEFQCSKGQYSTHTVLCEQGKIKFRHPQVVYRDIPVKLEYRHNKSFDLSFGAAQLRTGSVKGHLHWQAEHWLASVHGKLDLDKLKSFLPENATKNLAIAGKLHYKLRASGGAQGAAYVRLSGLIKEGHFTNPESTLVGEDLTLRTAMEAHSNRRGWRFNFDGRLISGQTYIDPFYIDADKEPVHIAGKGLWPHEGDAVTLSEFSYRHPQTLHAEGRLNVKLKPKISLQSAQLAVKQAQLPGVYTTYLQPLLIGTMADDLETSGQFSGQLTIGGGQVTTAELALDGIHCQDRLERYGLTALNGMIIWRGDEGAPVSEIKFHEGHLSRIVLGHVNLRFRASRTEFRLFEPVEIPLLDGALKIDTFSLQDVGSEKVGWNLDAALAPVSMEKLTEAIGWPRMSGKLSGMIPDVGYQDGVLTVGGALLIRAFDGSIVVNDLVLEQPLQVGAQLSGNVMINNIDLETLTRTFSFGKIQGRLGGYIRDLKLVNWRPVAFKARIETPKGDRSRHRISQRAVDNLTSIGDGVSGALSTGFLRFFEDFSYNRIGISCHLSNGVCLMNGIREADNGGFYIVEGAWLPRIDIIGHQHNVDWNELVERLQNIDTHQGPVVE